MKIDLNNAITLILGLLALIGYVYKLAEIKADINARISRLEANTLTAIDNLKDELVKEVTQNKHKVDLHLVEWQEKKEVYSYRFGTLEQLVKHKFDRLNGYIKQITGFLHKKDQFIIREDEW